MSIPSDNHLRLPMLKIMGDNKERHKSEIFDSLDKKFQFSEEDKAQKLESGDYRLIDRMVRALTKLNDANLLENTTRGCYKITQQGQEALKENPSSIDLERFKVLIKDTELFDVLVGYFYTSGFHALYKSLETTKKIRILIGISANKETENLIQTHFKRNSSTDYSSLMLKQSDIFLI